MLLLLHPTLQLMVLVVILTIGVDQAQRCWQLIVLQVGRPRCYMNMRVEPAVPSL